MSEPDRTLKNTVRRVVDQGARNLPRRARELPGVAVRTAVIGFGHVLLAADRMRQEYGVIHRTHVQPTVTRLREKGIAAVGRPAAKGAAPQTPGPEPTRAAPETPTATATTPAPEKPTTATTPAPEKPTTATTPAPPTLPIDNYDSLSMESLRARLRRLGADDLAVLLDYERSHANRSNVITMFENRIAKLEREGPG